MEDYGRFVNVIDAEVSGFCTELSGPTQAERGDWASSVPGRRS